MQCQRPIQGLHSLHLECKTMSLTLHLGLFVIHVLSPSWLFVLEVLWLVQFAFYDCKWDRGLLHAHSCVDIRVFLRFVYQCTFRCAYMLRCVYRNLCPVPNSTSSSPSITISWNVGWLDVDLDQRCELNTNLSLSGSGAISGRSKKAKFLRIVLTLRFAFAISNNLG